MKGCKEEAAGSARRIRDGRLMYVDVVLPVPGAIAVLTLLFLVAAAPCRLTD